jgi:hypothetical protein
MSALGHEQTFCDAEAMSALPPESGHQSARVSCPLWANSGHGGSVGRENAAMGDTTLDADHPFLAPFRMDLN